AAEFALVRVRPSRLEALRRAGSRRAAAALRLVRHLDSTFAIIQVGITLANLGIGWIGEPAVASILDPVFRGIGGQRYAHPLSFGIAFVAITVFTVILGELVPRGFGIRWTEPIALMAGAPL